MDKEQHCLKQSLELLLVLNLEKEKCGGLGFFGERQRSFYKSKYSSGILLHLEHMTFDDTNFTLLLC